MAACVAYQAATDVELAENQIAIAISDGGFGSHLGIAYRLGDDKPVILHLAFHKRLAQVAYPSVDPWLVYVMALHPLLADQLVGILDAMSSRYQGGTNGGIEYGINLYDSLRSISFDAEYRPFGESDGLTCASFVAAIFEAMQIPLVDITTWEIDALNKVWGEAVICFLRAFGADEEHIDTVQKNNNGLRLRPDEVAGAAIGFVPGKPKTYQDVQPSARGIIARVREFCGPADRGHDGNPYARCQKTYYQAIDDIVAQRVNLVTVIQNLAKKT
ncbi:hypothetical protein [Massilia sp.]|uniref:hypothetical protein n=1 Tax=Massilia sp. TaxID=1882437 RepID=UPI00352E5E36